MKHQACDESSVSGDHAGARLAAFACLLAALGGGCDAAVPGLGIGLKIPASVQMEAWESLAPTACRGRLSNWGSYTAPGVRVNLRYATPRGDTVLIISPSIANIPAGGSVVFFAPPQVTRGELRFPKLDTLTWSGGGAPGEGGPRCSWPYWCRLSSDSVSGQVYFPGAIDPPANSGLAYHVVARLEIGGSLTEVPVKPDPLGGFWRNYSNLPPGWGGPGHPGFLKAPVRDSAGVALEPKVISVRWENFAGVMDSVIPPYATGSGTGQLVDCYFARR